jgi:hypothetical protein
MTRTATHTAPATSVMTENIVRAFTYTTAEDRTSGKTWYDSARTLAHTLDPANPRRAAAVIAVLSPRRSWPQNVKLAQDAYAGVPLHTLGDHVRKVARLMAGETPEDVVSGPKVTSFFRNIIGDDVEAAVTVDRHAIDVATDAINTDAVRNGILSRKGEYNRVVAAYLAAAAVISARTGEHWTGSQVQAVVWVYWRRERAAANHG